MAATPTHRAIDAVWRIESARLIAGARAHGARRRPRRGPRAGRARRALEQWPESGVPDNPGAWLMATAKHRAIDLLRRAQHARAQAARSSARELEDRRREPDLDAALDRRRRRRPAAARVHCCHPVLSTEARVALTLRLLGGLTTDGDRARLPRPGADGRAADRARQAHARRGARAVRGAERRRAARRGSPSVLEVVYLVFNEGYSATAGDDWMRPALCERGAAARPHPRRARAARARGARPRRADGDPGVARAARVGAGRRAGAAARPGPRALGPAADPPRARGARARRAARRRRSARTRCRPRSPPATRARARAEDDRLGAHRRALRRARRSSRRRPSSSSTARSRSRWRSARRRASSSSTRCADEPSLAGYHLLPSVRGDLLAKLGRVDEARAEFERAAALTAQRARARAAARARRRAVAQRSASIIGPGLAMW